MYDRGKWYIHVFLEPKFMKRKEYKYNNQLCGFQIKTVNSR